ncbi:phenylalanine--tRNA ligase subunit alpha [Oceanivirga miroungae]|uniref:Phenylalanine--tRNA ligase alpha subunit n=1 Tax=Oceanivirga miroungae TaxID=1130046 RepID=A0A6I8MB25_9FUSO|nr:phenylalanine--tRNA ligase subunit alpha [Oceanivirga miroungae]VWL85968.1 phenylalanyl-tRNA synthetase subunit alpha [Oceanivirga miroungae]
MIEKLRILTEKIHEKLNEVKNLEELNEIRILALGKKSEINLLMKEMGKLEAEKRKEVGLVINEEKAKIQEIIDTKTKEIKNYLKEKRIQEETIDVSLKGRINRLGTIHPITKTLMEVKEIVMEMGFDIVDGPEVELVEYNFDALNIPLTHPSREKTDTFYISDNILLRTQTSPMQIRYMNDNKPPFRMISLGKVYRPDYDVSHTPMFHQIEGLMVGEDVSFSNFKAVLELIVKRIFGQDRKVRFRPHFFPFTEPSAEMDVECGVCNGSGCRLCKYTGWLEILGSGMVNPKVLENVGIDPKKYHGFAFGIGVERVTMLKYGIDDLRAFYENDIRFLEQF